MKTERQIARDMAFKFISGKHLATLATVDGQGRPHAAAVHFVAHKSFDIYFTSRFESRKFQNLDSHPIVAMSITDEKSLTTVQLTGRAEPIEELDVEQAILSELWRLRFNDSVWPPPAVQLFDNGATNTLMVVRVRPFEMTLANFETLLDGKYKSFFQKII